LLPFQKRKANEVEVELEAEDLIPVEEDRASSPPSTRDDRSNRAETRPRRGTVPPVSYRVLDEAVEEDVAGECLKSIAAEVDASGAFRSSGRLRAAPRVWTVPPPALPAPSPVSASRLPAVTSPPFVRTQATPSPIFARTSEPPSAPQSAAPSTSKAFASPPSSSSSSVVPAAPPSSDKLTTVRNASSLPPVSLGNTPEPTVIVVRERPKAGWIIAAAMIGAVCAVFGTRLVGSASVEEHAGANASAPPPAVTSVTTIATALVAPPPSSAKPPSIVRFDDDQGVAIPALQSSTSASAAAKTARPTPRPTHAPASAASQAAPPPATPTPPPPAPAAPAAVEAPKKKVLTPEQQLAEAQLKASMK
jgi:hypothetical protein